MEDAQENATAWASRLASVVGRGRRGTNVSDSLFNVLVYRVSGMRSSQRSKQSSVFGGRKSFFERTGISFRQWLFVFFEMLLSSVWWVIRERRRAIDDLNRKGITERLELIDLYLRRACGSFLSLLVGYLADTYFNMYVMAIFNVGLHFVISTIMFMEVMIRFGDFDQYEEFFYRSVGILIIPLKATDFARYVDNRGHAVHVVDIPMLVYGLQIVGRKNVKMTILFIFYMVWMNERAVGGAVVTLLSRLELTWQSLIRTSFVLSGATLAGYIYAFKPLREKFEISHGPVGNDFIGCIVTALWTRHRFKAYLAGEKHNWLDYAEINYERAVVKRTRDLLKLYCLILPTVGFSLFATPRSDFYIVLWDHLVPSGMFLATGILDGAAIVTILAMGIMQLIFIPLAERTGIKISFLPRFVIGYVCAIICMWYTTGILQSLEETLPTPRTGMVRIFNARDDHVRVISHESMMMFDRVLEPKEDVKLTLNVREATLFKVRLTFKETNITTHLSAQPDVMVGYVLLDPAAIVKMGVKIPVRDLAAGKNNPKLPKLYVFNALLSEVTVEFRAKDLGVHPFKVGPGAVAYDQVPPGTYQLRTLEFESNGAKNITMEAGGFYGVIAHESSIETLLTADTLILNNRLDTVYMIGVNIPYGFALVLTYVTLRSMVFINTPEGMEGLSFGFLDFLDNLPFWLIWIGFKTWHPFVTSYCLWIYSTIELLMMFGCIFVFIKFGNWYKSQ